MEVVGYVDPLSGAPGEEISLHVSCDSDTFTTSVVRLLHGDPHPDGPGWKAQAVPGLAEAKHRGRRQPLRAGSYIQVSGVDAPWGQRGFVIQISVMPSHLLGDRSRRAAGQENAANTRWTLSVPVDAVTPQTLASWASDTGGWWLRLSPDGLVSFTVTEGSETASVAASTPLLPHVWYDIRATADVDSGFIAVDIQPRVPHPQGSWARMLPEHVEHQTRCIPAVGLGALLLGAEQATDEMGPYVGHSFSGKVGSPALLEAGTLAPIGRWDLSVQPGSRDVIDVSGGGRHGRTVNFPLRGVTGPDWVESTESFHDAPEQYDAIHLHEDDLDDARWDPCLRLTIPDNMPSGAYAFVLTSSSGTVDHVPFVVLPPKDGPTADVLLILPTFSYLAYANEHSLWWRSDQPEDAYLLRHRLNGIYDKHLNDPGGQGVAFSSWRRPLMNVRPHYYWHALRAGAGGAHQFSADLHLIDWLHEIGQKVDIITDAEFDRRGMDALSPYRVAMTGTHAEYWSRRMLDGLEGYLAAGGRVMHMSGNGLYWVTGMDETEGHTVEVRRSLGMSGGWYSRPGEGHLTTTGERGGAWRQHGLAPQKYVGVGTAAFLADSAAGRGGPFTFQPGSQDPRVNFILDGIDTTGLLGDFPNLVNGWGPVGYEADRFDVHLGSPQHTVVIASAVPETNEALIPCFEETLGSNPRADVVFFETDSGGAVFATGSISWAGSLFFDGYENNIARMTRNVLERFTSAEPFDLPTLPRP